MPAIVTLALLFSTLMLILTTGAVVILFWHSARREVYTYFSWLLFAVVVWVMISIATHTTQEIDTGWNWYGFTFEIGFALTMVTAYTFATKLMDVRGRGGLFVFIIGIVVLVFSRLFTFALDLNNLFPTLGELVFLLFVLVILILIWQHGAKIDHPTLRNGLLVLSGGQLAGLLFPQIRTNAITEWVSALAVFIIGFALVQRDIMEPLIERTTELEIIRDVGVAMTSSVQSGEVLNAIAAQATTLVAGDGSAIYLRREERWVLAAADQIPGAFVGYTLPLAEGIVGKVGQSRQGQLLNDYQREWQGRADMPFAFESFGSVIGVPLRFREDIVGVLLVIQGKAGRLFTESDMHLLTLIAPQAAVSITNSTLFEQERALSNEVLAAKQQLEAFLSSTENPVIALNRKLEVVFANPAAESLIAYGMQGKPITDLISPDHLPNVAELRRDIRQKQAHVYEVSLKDEDYLCHVARLRKPARGWVVVLNDVTKLKAVDRLKSQMVRMTSHDLKNPLFAVMTYMELLEVDGETIFTEDMHYYTEAIHKQLARMERIIKGILDLEKVQSGAPPMSACNFREIVMNAVHGIEAHIRQKNQYFQQEIEPNLGYVLGDAPQLEQVIMNLLDNAVKYTPSEGTITLRAYQRDGVAIVEVQDTGVGIPREVQNQVFDRFFRVPAHELTVEGTGVGLSLVKAIIDHHKGRVWLHSEEGKGTIFYITLPLVKK